MPGVPGKGGVAGRSGRKPGPTADWPKFSTRLPDDVIARAKEAGPQKVAEVLRAGLP